MLSKSRSETITMPMICSLIEHGFLPVFSVERKVMLYSNFIYITITISHVGKHKAIQHTLVTFWNKSPSGGGEDYLPTTEKNNSHKD